MKANRCKEAMKAGRVPIGHMLVEFGTRGMAQILAQTGIDFVVIDTEHTAFDDGDIANLAAWFKATEIAPFVRIPQPLYHFAARALDFGALGVMVPNVKTAEEAKTVVDAVKYAPLGQRGVMLGNTNTDFAAVNPPEFMEYANENTTIICQIESVEGMSNLEAIAATPGVDVLWVGHFDLTQSMGIPGQFDDERFLANLRRVVEVAAHYGKGAGIQPGSMAQAQEWIELGFNVISYSSDMGVYLDAMKRTVADVRELVG